MDEMFAEERATRLRRLKTAEDVATARAKDAAERHGQCLANPDSTKEEQLDALAASIKFHEEAAAACARLIEVLRGDEAAEAGES